MKIQSLQKLLLSIVCISIFLVILGLVLYKPVISCQFENEKIKKSETSLFDDFSEIQPDFESVVRIMDRIRPEMEKSGEKLVFFSEENGIGSMSINGEEILLSEEESHSVENIYWSFYLRAKSASVLSFASFEGDDICFYADTGWYFMYYIRNDNPNKHTFDIEGSDVGVLRLAPCWYQVIVRN